MAAGLAVKITMRYEKKMRLALTSISVGLALTSISLVASACEPGGSPIIENRLNQELRITVTHVHDDSTLGKPVDYGIIPPLTTKRLAGIAFPSHQWVERIQATDLSGKVVFWNDYNMGDLEKIGWKITIPP